jgi:hypothetical protein
VWRAAQWYPELVSHVFSVCTPYTAPHKEYHSTEDLVKGPLPQFAYQLHLASGEVEKSVKDEHSIRQFLKGLYGARGPNGELAFDPEKGVLPENLPIIGESRILNGKVSSNPFLYSKNCQSKHDGGMMRERSLHCDICFHGLRVEAEEITEPLRRRVLSSRSLSYMGRSLMA